MNWRISEELVFKSPLVPNHKGLKGDKDLGLYPVNKEAHKIYKHKDKMDKQNN